MRLVLLLALVLAVSSAAYGRRFGRRGGGRGRNKPEVTCSDLKAQSICNGDASLVGFKVSDGCNLCTCGSNAGQATCTIKSCPRQTEILEPRLKRRADRFCQKLARRVEKKKLRYKRRMERRAAVAAAAGGSAEPERWPIKCFKERKLCRQQPGVKFFDGCNQCQCPDTPATAAQCETSNTCPEFVGSKREFKRHCRSLGANIEGGRRGNRRRGRRQRGSLMQWLAQRF
ncbi:hypothetical protein BOX15_Mlig033905g2 [Macrostomum lignano]|uniref:Pacifastin domain-containing protein n=1 Tax=Macrostomum lignano TaxID=282301 RepID=A0A267G0L3_9PLAT|nr:hypothetical protein BOX15_Mlig033905g2 [Macrostomum lignano]